MRIYYLRFKLIKLRSNYLILKIQLQLSLFVMVSIFNIPYTIFHHILYFTNQFDLKGKRLDLRTSSTSCSVSLILLLKDSISANNITNRAKCSSILFIMLASSAILTRSSDSCSFLFSRTLFNLSISFPNIRFWVSDNVRVDHECRIAAFRFRAHNLFASTGQYILFAIE